MALTRRDITEGMLILVRFQIEGCHAFPALVTRVMLPFLIVKRVIGLYSATPEVTLQRVDLNNVRIWAIRPADLTPEEREALA